MIGAKSNDLLCLAKLVGFGGIFCQGVTNLVKIYFGGVFSENGRKQPNWRVFLGIDRGFRDIKSIKTKSTKLVSPWYFLFDKMIMDFMLQILHPCVFQDNQPNASGRPCGLSSCF